MKLCLIICFYVFSSLLYAQDEHFEYFHTIHDAEYALIVNEDHTKAFEKYCSAFQIQKPVFYNYIQACEAALLSHHKDSCFAWLTEYFKYGCSKYLVEHNETFKDLFNKEDWRHIDSLHREGNRYFFSTVNYKLLEELHFLFSTDVYLGSESEQLFDSDSLKWLIRRKVFSNNLQKLVELIKEEGYPGYSDVGYFTKYLYIILIHARNDSKKDSTNLAFLKEKMFVAVKEGEASPGIYAKLTDLMVHVWEDGQEQVYGNWKNQRTNSFFPIMNICEVDERRKSIGLPSLEDYAKIKSIQLPPEYQDCK